MTVSELDEILNVIKEAEQVERYEAWQHTAFLCSLLANINRDSKAKAYTIEDFMPVKYPGQKEQEPTKRQTWQEIKAEMKVFAKVMNKGRRVTQ